MEIQMPQELADAGAKVAIRYSSLGWLGKGDKVYLPTSINIQWKLKVNGFESGYKTKHVDCSPLVVETGDWCLMEIQVPDPGLRNAGAQVAIRYSSFGWMGHGDKVYLPTSINIQWQLKVNDSESGYKTKHVDCTPLVVECKAQIKLPPGVWIYIEGKDWFQHSDWIDMVPTKPFRYKLYDRTQKVRTDWKAQTFSAADCGKEWDLTGAYCNMKVDIPVDTWVYIENVGWSQDGNDDWMPVGASFRYKAYDAKKKVRTGWLTHNVDCNGLKPEYCEMEVQIPAGTWVYIENVGWFQNGAKIQMPMGTSFRYKAYDAAKKVRTDWLTHDVDCGPLKPEYCNMHVELPPDVWVYIENVGWFQNSTYLQMPMGTSFRYKAYDAAKKVRTGWLTHNVDCDPLAPGYCEMEVQIPAGTWVYIENVGWLQNGAKVWMPMGASFRYKAYDAKQKVRTGWLTHDVDCRPLKPEYCNMHVELPPDVWVYIENVGWFQNCTYLWMPSGASFRYKAYDAKQKVRTGWQTKKVDCNALKPGYCHMVVDLDGGDGWVYIENVGWFQDGAKVWMPSGASFRYKAYDAKQKVRTGWQTKKVDCNALKPGYCHMEVDLEKGVWEKVYIENVGWFQDGAKLWMPSGASFRYKAYDVNGERTGWLTKDVDCTPLKPPCRVHIVLPPGVWIYIENIGWFQNCQWVELKPVKSFRYKLYDTTKKVGTGWKSKTLNASDCGKDWDLTGEYCHMHVNLDGGDGWVYIENVGWFQHSTHLWMPSGATFRYKAYNANKKVGTAWKSHTVDCNDLYPGFCHMEVDLDDGDGWVYIENVDYFQDGAKIWMPKTASFRYKAYDKTRKVVRDWRTHVVDCGLLKPGYCHMHVNLDGGDGWVYIENVGWFQHSTHLWMPSGATFRYKAYDKTQKVGTAWKSHTVDCNDLYPGFCHMEVDLDTGDGWVYIENVGYFQDGDYKWMPSGASFRYKAYDSTKKVSTGWKTRSVDCTALKPGFCNMGITLGDPYEWVYIENVGWFQDGSSDWMPKTASFRFKAYDVNKQNGTAWVTKNVDCTDLVYPPPE
jgi:hypothetical protein